MKIVGLFAGIGGIEFGLERAGHNVAAVSEFDAFASAVLAHRFPETPNLGDIRVLKCLPPCDVVTAGFPCQDLSQAGLTAGIFGRKSGLIERAFDLIGSARRRPEWILFENVPFLLSLQKGNGMSWLTRQFAKLGYKWAYRVIDTRAFGLAQRRRRLFILASRSAEPAEVLFHESGAPREPASAPNIPCGFYWTEGNTGIGWAIDAIPPLKCGSALGIVSPPAIWLPGSRSIVTPTIEDAEALQGFGRGWTKAATRWQRGERARWKLVGNAVSVPASEWIGRQFLKVPKPPNLAIEKMREDENWPCAAYGHDHMRFRISASEWPSRRGYRGLLHFLSSNASQLSYRATKGFYGRLIKSRLRAPEQFIDDLAYHIAALETHADDRLCDQKKNVAHSRSRQSSRASAEVVAI